MKKWKIIVVFLFLFFFQNSLSYVLAQELQSSVPKSEEMDLIVLLDTSGTMGQEKGIHEIPVWAVIKLAQYYKVSTDYILGLSDER